MASPYAGLDLATTPALAPPPGVIPNLNHGPTGLWIELAVTLPILAIITALIAIRIYTRFFLLRTHGWEDYTAILAWLLVFPYIIVGCVAEQYKFGVHQWNVSILELMNGAKLAQDVIILYSPIYIVTKLSIFIQQIHIFMPTRNGVAYRLTQVNMIATLLIYFAFFWIYVFQCTPREKIWNPTVPGHCVSTIPTYVFTGSFNVASDFLMLLVPLSLVLKLQMERKKKILVTLVFLTGLFACASSIMRLVTGIQLVYATDISYRTLPVGLWTLGEIASGIIIGCMPTLPKFYRHIRGKVVSRHSSENNEKQDHTPEADVSRRVAPEAGGEAGPKKGLLPLWKKTPPHFEIPGSSYFKLSGQRNGSQDSTDTTRPLSRPDAAHMA